ncbi:fatty acid--CoA ligase family protein [Saccharopolyspora gloriosae]|uniref:Acyl-CoA synthetase (AMP-forming)/AMP-acid ligase II n=1 Tax=Saccharopolyspora gloriosae TaxID=455344 RepID=A0A840N9N3_9PSEU|nr:fatty acid--CoA ligase family protein [Saccharopolyspora gloriosae]MBB5068896.1 acyl-CoA synthetase (AMP-forming)/AMP-acid ligase II [Saccharopolyspora gloriosae]
MGAANPAGDHHHEDRAQPFPQALLDALGADPLTPAFEQDGRVLVRGELLELVGRCTAGLRAAGLGNRSGVAIATAVSAEGFAAQLAAHVLGCRVVVLRPGLTPQQLAHILDQDIDAVVTDDPTTRLRTAAGGATVLTIGPDLLRDQETPVARGELDDPAIITFTSGSTGTPKGTVFDYRALTRHWSWQLPEWTDETARLAANYRRFLLFGTLSSAVVQEHLALCLNSGGTAVIPTGTPEFPDVLAELSITACLLTVARLHQILDDLSERDVDLSAARMLLVAGSPLEPHRLAQAHARIGSAVHLGYGQTELGMISLLSADDIAAHPAAAHSVGRPRDGVELEIRDDTGAPVPIGADGEVWVRVPNALSGYWRAPEETAAVLHDGRVRTRDLGHLDHDGFLHLTGRTRDVIMVNAVLHYAGPIERVLASHPDVDQAYVAGAPDARTGEAVHAYLVAAGARNPDHESLRALVAAELGAGAVPATITVLPEVPLTPAGKPDKNALLALRTIPAPR